MLIALYFKLGLKFCLETEMQFEVCAGERKPWNNCKKKENQLTLRPDYFKMTGIGNLSAFGHHMVLIYVYCNIVLYISV